MDRDPSGAALVSGASDPALRPSTSVMVSVIGAPTASRGRIIRRLWIVSRGGWIVAVVAVWVVIRIIVRVCEHGAEGESSEPTSLQIYMSIHDKRQFMLN